MIAGAADLDRAELRQMRRQELGVEQAVAAEPQPRDQMHQRDLAGVGLAAEHALAEERGAERDAVKPADQLAVVPALDAVRRAAGEERRVEPHDLVVDPGRRARFAGLGAAPHHRLEGGVAADLEAALAQHAPQPARHMKRVERQDRRAGCGSTQNSSGSSADSAIGKMPAA